MGSQNRMIGGMALRPKPAGTLTFGIELEFQAECPRIYAVSPGGHKLIFDTLTKGGTPMVLFPDELNFKGKSLQDFNKWGIEKDLSIRPRFKLLTWNEEKQASTTLTQVELISRVLKDELASFEEIRSVCNRLHAGFQTYTDKSTGYHVHVGNGEDGFTLSALKALASILVAFEPFINQIHPVSRVRSRSGNSNPFCKLLSASDGFGGASSTKERLYQIHLAKSTTALVQLINSQVRGAAIGSLHGVSRMFSYNFTNLLSTPEPGLAFKPTVEFRQHAGTTDPEAINNWVTFAIHLVKFSQTASSVMLDKLLEKADSRAFGLQGLMRHIGCPQLWNYYGTRLYDHSPPEAKTISVNIPQLSSPYWLDYRRSGGNQSSYPPPPRPQDPVMRTVWPPNIQDSSNPSGSSGSSSSEDVPIAAIRQKDALQDTSENSIFDQDMPPILETNLQDVSTPHLNQTGPLVPGLDPSDREGRTFPMFLDRRWGRGSRDLEAMRQRYKPKATEDLSAEGEKTRKELQKLKPIALGSVREYGEASSEAEFRLLKPEAMPRFPHMHKSRWNEGAIHRDRAVRARSLSPLCDDQEENFGFAEEEIPPGGAPEAQISGLRDPGVAVRPQGVAESTLHSSNESQNFKWDPAHDDLYTDRY